MKDQNQLSHENHYPHTLKNRVILLPAFRPLAGVYVLSGISKTGKEMVTTYLRDSELEAFKTVPDKELNELLQEVNQKTGGKFLIEEHAYEQQTGFLWFRKTKLVKFYTLYGVLSLPEVQAINFCQEDKWPGWSINTSVTKSYIVTYLLGLLAGMAYNKKSVTA